jgi:hypothetical protein
MRDKDKLSAADIPRASFGLEVARHQPMLLGLS